MEIKKPKLIYQQYCTCHCGTVLRVWENDISYPPEQRYRIQMQIPRDINCHLTKKNRFFDLFVNKLPKLRNKQ